MTPFKQHPIIHQAALSASAAKGLPFARFVSRFQRPPSSPSEATPWTPSVGSVHRSAVSWLFSGFQAQLDGSTSNVQSYARTKQSKWLLRSRIVGCFLSSPMNALERSRIKTTCLPLVIGLFVLFVSLFGWLVDGSSKEYADPMGSVFRLRPLSN